MKKGHSEKEKPSGFGWSILLGFLVFTSALGIIYSKHESRQLFTQLQRLQQEIESRQMTWSQLLLEQGTWASDARVERVAREHLQMILPEPNEVRVITDEEDVTISR